MGGGCNNTGVLTFDEVDSHGEQIITGRIRIKSLKVMNDATVNKTVTFYDGTDDSATKIAVVHVGTLNQNIDYDMHGSIAVNGVYVKITGTGANSGVSFSVQYF